MKGGGREIVYDFSGGTIIEDRDQEEKSKHVLMSDFEKNRPSDDVVSISALVFPTAKNNMEQRLELSDYKDWEDLNNEMNARWEKSLHETASFGQRELRVICKNGDVCRVKGIVGTIYLYFIQNSRFRQGKGPDVSITEGYPVLFNMTGEMRYRAVLAFYPPSISKIPERIPVTDKYPSIAWNPRHVPFSRDVVKNSSKRYHQLKTSKQVEAEADIHHVIDPKKIPNSQTFKYSSVDYEEGIELKLTKNLK